MIINFLIVIILGVLSLTTPAYADSTPTLTEPENNSSTSDISPKLSWEYSAKCPSEGSCYVVEISNNENFTQVEKSTYTNNTSYSPTLSEGIWFWHVKAKGENGVWSNFSSSHKLTISKSSVQSPTPQPSSQPTEKPTPTPSTKPIEENKGSTNEKTFMISPDKTILNSNESLNIQIELNNYTPNTTYYLKPSFFQEGSTNYFGLTEINGNWIKNSVTATSQLQITTDSSGNWSGKINAKIDTEDSGFKGSSEYNIKVARYNNSGSGLTWSNSAKITVNQIEENSINTAEESPTPEPDVRAEVLAEEFISTEFDDIQNNEEATSEPQIDYQIATISAETKPLPPTQKALIAGDIKTNWWFISSGFSLLLLAGCYVVYQRKKMYHS